MHMYSKLVNANKKNLRDISLYHLLKNCITITCIWFIIEGNEH